MSINLECDGCYKKDERTFWLDIPLGASQLEIFNIWHAECGVYGGWHWHKDKLLCRECYRPIEDKINEELHKKWNIKNGI